MKRNKRKYLERETKKMTLEQYLNYYFNPHFSVSLKNFYKDYFGHCNHERFLEKIDLMVEEVKNWNGFSSETEYEGRLTPGFYYKYKNELDTLCEGIDPITCYEVKECELLTGEILLVQDKEGNRKYYRYHSPLYDVNKISYEDQIGKEKILVHILHK